MTLFLAKLYRQKLSRGSVVTIVILLTAVAFLLRIYQVGLSDFKEDENTTVKAAAYLYYCHQDQSNCRQSTNQRDTTFKNKLLVLLTNNETKPNLATEIYFWDWVSRSPTKTHYARAWPHLSLLASTYQILGISELSSRIISVIAGILLIPISFFFARFFLGSTLMSLVYAFLITISFYLIDFSRHARMYAVFITVFLLAVYFTFKALEERQKRLINLLLAGFLLIFAYWLQLLTLLLPLAILVYSFYFGFIKKQPKSRTVFWILSAGLAVLLYLKLKLGIDFFYSYFSSWQAQPRWQYLKFIFSYPLPAIIALGLVLTNLPHLLRQKKSGFLAMIIIVNLVYLIFFSKTPPASAYTIHLLPISLWLVLLTLDYWLKKKEHFRAIILSILILLATTKWIMSFPYLYLGRDDRARPSQAYQAITENFKPGDQIIGIYIRDYYLKTLPSQTPVINLAANKSLTKPEFISIIDQAEQSFITWEKEKEVHLKPEIITYIKTNFDQLAGQGLDDNQVEIYYLAK